MPVQALFPTHFYEAEIGDDALLADLDAAVRELARQDRAGIRWSRDHGYRGYTSYASLGDLTVRDPAFGALVRHLNRHVARYVREAGWQAGRLRLDSLWVNLMKPGAVHSGHIHPHSAVSGTVYVAVPEGAGALRLEDPRLPLMMAAPLREGTFHYAEPRPGTVFLWESWLRHEVMPHAGKGERISISFNYR